MIKFKAIHDYSPKKRVICLDGYLPTCGIYLDGELEDDCGFDIAYATNCSSVILHKHNEDIMYANLPIGIYPVEVDFADPDRECIAFIWEVKNPNSNFNYPYMGLITYSDDLKAYKSAMSKYENKIQTL